jgi:hypothetical protein
MAIRRGPLAVPDDATDVFDVNAYSGDGQRNIKISVDAVPDLLLLKERNNNYSTNWGLYDRVRGAGIELRPNTNGAESNQSDKISELGNNYYKVGSTQQWNYSGSTYGAWIWKRAPGYFDVVAYTGNGTAGRTISHNLGVAPEMMWVTLRNAGNMDWAVYHKDYYQGRFYLNEDSAYSAASGVWNSTLAGANSFTVGSSSFTNLNTYHYIAYLFTTLAGVSKVGSVSHSFNSTTNVDCGFSSGARFVLVKSTSSGDWRVWDSTRGIVSGNDPYLALNKTDVEVTNGDLIDPYSGGFALSPSFYTDTYIFYAIA